MKLKLHKPTRKRIYDGQRRQEAVEIPWPLTADVEPLSGHKYAVRHFDSETRLVVVSRRKVTINGKKRWKVVVKLDNDPIRSLPGLQGVRKDDGSYETEPEPVSRKYQKLLDAEGLLKTAQAGKLQRTRAKVLAEEQRALDARRRGRKGTVLYIERVERHREQRKAA